MDRKSALRSKLDTAAANAAVNSAAAQSSSVRDQMPEDTVNLVANGQEVFRIRGSAKYFAVLSCSAPFKLETDQRGKQTADRGYRIGGEDFRRLVFFETAGAANTIRFYYGDEALNHTQVIEQQGLSWVGGTLSITASSNVEFLPTHDSPTHNSPTSFYQPTTGLKRTRFRFINTSGTITISLQFWDGSAWNIFETLAPGEKSIIFEQSENVLVVNPSLTTQVNIYFQQWFATL